MIITIFETVRSEVMREKDNIDESRKDNSILDIEGLMVGHYTDINAMSGVTAIICTEGAVASVDVRGSAPGTRETDLLDPVNLVEKVQGIILSGGSVFGLAASDGAVRWMAEKGFGIQLGGSHVAPIVPGATLYDLGRGRDFVPSINSEWGRKACDNAEGNSLACGCVGAGVGAISGGIKGGVGTASLSLDNGIIVAAIVAVNSLGSVINPMSGRPWEFGLEINGEFGYQGKRAVKVPPAEGHLMVENTTIGVVATDANLSKVQALKIAQMAHDGMARAIRPSHTMFDGDTVFCLATCKKQVPESRGVFPYPKANAINELGDAAANCMSRAIIKGVLSAESLGGITAFCDLEDL